MDQRDPTPDLPTSGRSSLEGEDGNKNPGSDGGENGSSPAGGGEDDNVDGNGDEPEENSENETGAE